MKEKIIVFFVGLLVGAIISTGSIYFYTVATNNSNNQGMQMTGDNQGGGMNQNGGTPPEMPNGNAQNSAQS